VIESSSKISIAVCLFLTQYNSCFNRDQVCHQASAKGRSWKSVYCCRM